MLHARRREGLLRPRPVPHSCAIQVGTADVGAVVGGAGARTTAAAILAAAGVDDAAALVASAIHADVVVVDALRSGALRSVTGDGTDRVVSLAFAKSEAGADAAARCSDASAAESLWTYLLYGFLDGTRNEVGVFFFFAKLISYLATATADATRRDATRRDATRRDAT